MSRAGGASGVGAAAVRASRSSWRRWWGVFASGVVLLAGGATYRWNAAGVAAELDEKVQLETPLATLPMRIGAWDGRDEPLSAGVLRIAGNDDYVNRTYTDAQTGQTVQLYIGYTARPRTMLRHRPTVCYPSAGWSHVSTRACSVIVPPQVPDSVDGRSAQDDATTGPVAVAPLATGREASEPPSPASRAAPGPGMSQPLASASAGFEIPALLHTFFRPGPPETRVVVLNYYVLNGEPTNDEQSFWGLRWRDPRRQGPQHYVAQIQVAATAGSNPQMAEQAVSRFAAGTADAILALLPGAAK